MEKREIKYAFQGEKENVLGYFLYDEKQKLVVIGDLAKGLEKIANMNTARITIDKEQCNYQDFKKELNRCKEIVYL